MTDLTSISEELKLAGEQLADISAKITGLIEQLAVTPTSPPQREIIHLDVPHVSQIDVDSQGAFDCGQAHVVSVARAVGRTMHKGKPLTVELVCQAWAGHTMAIRLKLLIDLFAGVKSALLPVEPSDRMWITLRESVRDGYPVIILVDYEALGWFNPFIKGKVGLHWLLVCGIEGDMLVVNDPLHPNAQSGQMVLSWEAFKQAERQNNSPFLQVQL